MLVMNRGPGRWRHRHGGRVGAGSRSRGTRSLATRILRVWRKGNGEVLVVKGRGHGERDGQKGPVTRIEDRAVGDVRQFDRIPWSLFPGDSRAAALALQRGGSMTVG